MTVARLQTRRQRLWNFWNNFNLRKNKRRGRDGHVAALLLSFVYGTVIGIMKRKYIQKSIYKITKKIVDEYGPEKVILFGSHAWGKPHKDSDVDLFIVKKSRKRRIDRHYELRKKLMGNNFPPMDILVYTPKELARRLEIGDFFFDDIIQKGKVLYEKY